MIVIMCSNANLLMNFCHIVEIHSGQLLYASESVLLVIASNFCNSMARYTLNKLDISSKGLTWLEILQLYMALCALHGHGG